MNKFKVGDWVINSEGFIFRVTENNIHASGDFTIWQPKKGEWCWFWSDWTGIPELREFICIEGISIEKGGIYVVKPLKADKNYRYSQVAFNHCEPFIGELPSFLKD